MGWHSRGDGRQSFKVCGISNALDGKEHDANNTEEMPEFAYANDKEMDDEFDIDSKDDPVKTDHSSYKQTAPLGATTK